MTISHSPGTKTNYSVMALSIMSPNFFLSLFLIIFILGKENRKNAALNRHMQIHFEDKGGFLNNIKRLSN